MDQASKFYMVKKRALPEVLLKVAQVNALLGAGKAKTIREAIDAVGISRSSYYKYKDDIFPIHEKIQGKTITFVMEMEDRPGLLSNVLKVVAECNANILSIHQSIPVNHIALITLSVLVLPNTDDVAELFEKMGEGDALIEQALQQALDYLEDPALERNGYYAFVCRKCAPTFGYFGWFKAQRELNERADKIYEGA